MKEIYVEFASLSLLRHFLVKGATLFTACRRPSVYSLSMFPVTNSAVSPATVFSLVLNDLDMSFKYILLEYQSEHTSL